MWEWICRKWRLRIGRGVYWTETHGGQLLSGPKLTKSCSVYPEEEDYMVPNLLRCRLHTHMVHNTCRAHLRWMPCTFTRCVELCEKVPWARAATSTMAPITYPLFRNSYMVGYSGWMVPGSLKVVTYLITTEIPRGPTRPTQSPISLKSPPRANIFQQLRK